MNNSHAIIPESFINELVYWRDQITKGCWRIGDICNEVKALAMANAKANHEIITAETVEHDIAEVVGKSPNTVRLYSRIAAFFPPEIRKNYPDELPFSHYRWAASLGDRWREALDLSAGYAEQAGTVKSVFFLDKEIDSVGKVGETSQTKPVIAALPDGTVKVGNRLIDVNIEPARVSDLESSPFPPEDNTRVEDAWEEIDQIADAIRDRLSPLPVLLDRLAKLTGELEIVQEASRLTVAIRTLTDHIINQRPGGPGSDGAYVTPADQSYVIPIDQK